METCSCPAFPALHHLPFLLGVLAPTPSDTHTYQHGLSLSICVFQHLPSSKSPAQPGSPTNPTLTTPLPTQSEQQGFLEEVMA